MVINHPFVNSRLSDSNTQHSIIYFFNNKTAMINTKLQENISNKYVRIFGNSQQLCHFCIDGT